MNEDQRLLRLYIEDRSEEAFANLVARHIDLVYAVALRVLGGDRHLAQDVVQTVFTDLSRKAKFLQGVEVLAGWLHRHTFFLASTVVRSERRRRQREGESVQMSGQIQSVEPDWERCAPFLDEALQGLSTADRNAILLRYFKRLDLKSVGTALGATEDAAQKRISRALEKLHAGLAKRGVILTTATLTTAILSQVAAAPVGLAAHVTASVLADSGAGSGAVLTWSKFLAWLQTKAALVSATAILLGAATATYFLANHFGKTPEPDATRLAQTSPLPTNVAAAVPVGPSRFGFHWSQVESADYRQYVANLRAIGCPEATIRDIVIADLNQHFASRWQAIVGWSPPAYWKKSQNTRSSPDQVNRLIALDKERARILKELLGITLDSQELVDTVGLQSS